MQPLGRPAVVAALAAVQSPNLPTLVSLTQTAGSLTVTWGAAAVDSTHSAATGYNLQFSLSGAGVWTLVPSVTTPYLLSGLAVGTAYDIQVQSTNSAGASAWSAPSTLSTPVAAPNAPAAPSLGQGPGSTLVATWPAPAVDSTHNAATGFNLQVSPTGLGAWTVVTGVTSSYDLTGLAGSTAFDVQIQATNTGGASAWSATSTLTTGVAVPPVPNAPVITGVMPPADGTASKLAVSWNASVVDGTHGAATGYNLRFGPSGAGTWTTVMGVTSPYTMTGLAGATAIDVEVQATNAAPSPSAWSVTMTGTTWGATVATATWVAATTQVHNTSVAPNGGVNVTAVPAPTTVASSAFAWSTSAAAVPNSGLITTTPDGQPNGFGQWFNAPATAGTYYLWMLAQGSGGATIGALVSPAITVT